MRKTVQSEGFTLVELMVIIAVIAILAIAAMPSYRALMDHYRVRKAGEDVVSLVVNARAAAVKLHRPVNVAFTTGSSWCTGANSASAPSAGARAGAASACDCTTPSGCMVDTEQTAIPVGKHPGVSMTAATNGLVFDGVTGTSVGLVGSTVTLDSPLSMYTATVTVTPLGQASLVVSED